MNENGGMITLECPSCGGRTSFTVDAGRFVCDYCGNEQALDIPLGTARGEAVRRPPILLRPKKISVRKSERSLELSWRWFSSASLMLLLICLTWDAGLIAWLVSIDEISSANLLTCMAPYALVGLVLTYLTLASLFNRTTLFVEENTFSVRHDPVPWRGEVRVPIAELEGLHHEERYPSSKGDATTYHLHVALKNGHYIRLFSYLNSPTFGAYIKQQVESWLDISDSVIDVQPPA
jgi:hypothetical protein